MKLDFGDTYYLDCFVECGKPFIKLMGVYDTINYSSSRNEERTYLNRGFLAFKFLDFSSNIVLKNYSRFDSEDGNEVLINFVNNSNEEVYIYFNLNTEDVGFEIS